MSDPPDDAEPAGGQDVWTGRSAYRVALDVVLTGFAVILPILITLYIIATAMDFIGAAIAPVIAILEAVGFITAVKQFGLVQVLVELGVYQDVTAVLTEAIALVVLAAVVVGVGVLARVHYGERLIDYFDYTITAIPGIGTIYQSFRRMGDVMTQTDASNFREVKLVEFPHDDTYLLGFETNRAPGAVTTVADKGPMRTLFIPLAPNPVMGGFLAHIPEDRIFDIDMTVADGMRNIITTGIAQEAEDDRHGEAPQPVKRVREFRESSEFEPAERFRELGPDSGVEGLRPDVSGLLADTDLREHLFDPDEGIDLNWDEDVDVSLRRDPDAGVRLGVETADGEHVDVRVSRDDLEGLDVDVDREGED